MKLSLFRRCLLPVIAAVFCLCGPQAHGQEVSADEFAKWRKEAEQGNALAQSALGLCYRNGMGVVKDEKEAVKWLRKAAELGDARAQYFLGDCYANGTGVTKDEVEAVKWYRKAAEQGNEVAQLRLGFCYSNGWGVGTDVAEAAKWYRKAAEQGHPDAQYNLAACFAGGVGVVKDESESAKWLCKAAEQGHPDAQFNLGRCYYSGEGVEKDRLVAVKWIRKAAEQGHVTAQNNLASFYDDGEGVVKNEILAYQWFLLASANGNQTAKRNLPILEAKLTAEQRAEGQRLATEWEARHANREADQAAEPRSVTAAAGNDPKTTVTANDSKFSLKDIGPSVEAILSDEKTDKTELAYVGARGGALFLAISKLLDENPSSDRGELDKKLAQNYLESAHRFFKVAQFYGEITGMSEKNIHAQLSSLMEIYLQEMVRSKQLNNEIMSAPILRDFKEIQRVAPLVNELDKALETSQKVKTEEKQPKH